METLLQKYQEELRKVGLEFELKKELNSKFVGTVKENGILILEKWEVQKCLQWNFVRSFAQMTKENVEMHKKIFMNH